MGEWIETVTGKIPVEDMGKTLIHEHFVFGYPGFSGDVTLGPFDEHEALKAGIKAANAVKRNGVKTVVDPTPNECGRNPALLKKISESTGLQIICSTGYYYEGEGATPYFKFRYGLGTAQKDIYEMFMTEINEGIAKTGIRPGVIKLASSKDEITSYEKMFFDIAAKVHKETGIRIITHTQEGTMGPEQAKLLVESGVDPSKIVIGHMCGNTNVEYHEETLKTGVKIGFDRFGIQKLVGAPMDSERIETLVKLIEKGYEKQIMLSHDSITYWMGRPLEMNDDVAELVKNWHPTHLFENILPELKRNNVSEDVLNEMFYLKNKHEAKM
ncbi:phosphotriesterase-related protein [Virgibacillus sp. NKC19-16]|uniref:phosphotriesterase family protein n=1 Tax=Virgibacillus salidurans TaxID=2831673 RepID=UPI001F33D2BB|nr:phosphotriesterase-related protein [Virgibacillus sp. NKC19-16]UJL45539.1 phosphotriesterase-related protein [Virgibacillus sp. NKC19-16]